MGTSVTRDHNRGRDFQESPCGFQFTKPTEKFIVSLAAYWSAVYGSVHLNYEWLVCYFRKVVLRSLKETVLCFVLLFLICICHFFPYITYVESGCASLSSESGCGNPLWIWLCFEWSPLSLILSGVNHVLCKCLEFREMLLVTLRFKVLLESVAEGSLKMF